MDIASEDAMEISKPAENSYLPHDSMVTVRLSGPPSLTVVTQSLIINGQLDASTEGMFLDTLNLKGDCIEDLEPSLSRRNSLSTAAEDENMEPTPDTNDEQPQIGADERPGTESADDSDAGEVDWAELEKTEEQEPRDQDSEDVGREF